MESDWEKVNTSPGLTASWPRNLRDKCPAHYPDCLSSRSRSLPPNPFIGLFTKTFSRFLLFLLHPCFFFFYFLARPKLPTLHELNAPDSRHHLIPLMHLGLRPM